MTRQTFLQTSLALIFIDRFASKPKRKYCFNTLACPDWSLKEIFENAQKYGYKAIEIRGLKGDVDIINSPELAQSRLSEVNLLAKDHNIKILNLNSSGVLHEYETVKKQFNLDTAKRYIDLAEKLQCPFVRVFPDKFPKDKPKQFAIETIAQNYQTILDHCKNTQVKVLLDAHGDLVHTTDIKQIMNEVSSEHTGIIWDFFNMHLKTKESPSKMYQDLKKYIKLVQIKDGFFKSDGSHEYTLTGKGDVPIAEITQLLDTDNYKGYISFEWEKRWHPELPQPEVALPQFIQFMKTIN